MPFVLLFRRARRGCLAALLAGLFLPAAQAQAQAQAQGRDDAPVIDLGFRQFFELPVGPRGLVLSEALRRADGQRVRLTGHVVAREQATPGRFLLTPRPVRLSEHADGEADDLPPATVTVLLDERQADRVVVPPPGPVTLVGRLSVGRREAADGRVSWVRLHLDAEALDPEATRTASDLPAHAHR